MERTTKECFDQLYANKSVDLDETDSFKETVNVKTSPQKRQKREMTQLPQKMTSLNR